MPIVLESFDDVSNSANARQRFHMNRGNQSKWAYARDAEGSVRALVLSVRNAPICSAREVPRCADPPAVETSGGAVSGCGCALLLERTRRLAVVAHP
eukprot:6174660-Pleurochrysis_carterae.AAC.4